MPGGVTSCILALTTFVVINKVEYMFRIDNYLERWAEQFKPIGHVPNKGSKEKRFYRMDSITRLDDFTKNLINAKSPSMGVVTQMDGQLDGQSGKFIRYTHRVFFLVKQKGASGAIDEVAAADAKYEGNELAQKLIAYLYEDKVKNENKDLKGLVIETTAVITVPQMYNGWWPTEVVVEHLIPRNLCVNKEDYKEE